jgi:hypothetical protein
MATTCIVLNTQQPKKGKSIEFHQTIDGNGSLSGAGFSPDAWLFVELICKNFNQSKKDLIFAYNNDRDTGILYLGYWNDGIV